MKNRFIFYISSVAFIVLIYSCNKKTYPEKNDPPKNAAPVSAKEYLKEKAKQGDPAPPKIIVVTDNAAKKTATGKYYYDLNGYRYWKNNKDGKYYLDGIFSTGKKKNNK